MVLIKGWSLFFLRPPRCSLAKATADVLLLFLITELAPLRPPRATRSPPPPANKDYDEAFLPCVSRRKESRVDGSD